jgi:hypothetical protein
VLTFLADENFRLSIVDGLRRRIPALDIVRVQEVGLESADDPPILTWAADAGRVLLTHDVKTMPHFAYERVSLGLPMPGVVVVPWLLAIGASIDELVVLAECSYEGEWEGRVIHLPL